MGPSFTALTRVRLEPDDALLVSSVIQTRSMTRIFLTVVIVIACCLTAWTPVGVAAGEPHVSCVVDPDPPVYYQVKLVTTRKVRGARLAKGFGDVTYAASPFGVSISKRGTYVYNIDIQMSNLKLDEGMSLAAWVTTPQIDQIKALGRLDDNLTIRGKTDWNKFLLVITLEPAAGELGPKWRGPVVSRGMSRSGLMHTMAGHGPFETEPCAVYGY